MTLRNAYFPAVLLAVALPAISAAQEATPPADEEDTSMEAQEDTAPDTRGGTPVAEKRAEVPVSIVTLIDGQTLRGKVVSQTANSVTLELLSGGGMELKRSSIRSISEDKWVQVNSTGNVWFRDPNRTRYFYAPSAMMLKRGEGYFSQKELLFSAIAYGITDNVSVLLGSVVPLWFSPTTMNLIGAVKVGFSLNDNLHFAAGAETLAIPWLANGGVAGGFVFASATYGNPNAHITLSGGKPFALSWGSSSNVALGDALFVLAGEVRLGSRFALMTENWIMPYVFSTQPDVITVDAVGGRILGEQWAFDFGFIAVPKLGVPVAIPWIDFTYNFGG